MKRVTTLLALLLSLTAASIAIAAEGPGKFETKITGTSAKAANGMLDGTWVIDLANAHSGNLEKALAAEGRSREELGREEFVARVWRWRESTADGSSSS